VFNAWQFAISHVHTNRRHITVFGCRFLMMTTPKHYDHHCLQDICSLKPFPGVETKAIQDDAGLYGDPAIILGEGGALDFILAGLK